MMANPSSAPSVRTAFTLIELLIVISIVAVLAALLMAGLREAVKKSKSAVVEANLRSMAAALVAHTADNNGRLLDGAMGPTLAAGDLTTARGPGVAYWFNALDFYMAGKDYTLEGMKRVDRPKWQNDPLKVYPQLKASPAGYGYSIGYGWNHQYFGYDSSENPVNGTGWATRLGSIDAPSRTIIIGTGEDSVNEGNPTRNLMIYANTIRCRRFNGGGYYLFLDGHVERLTPEEVMTNNSYLMRRQK